MRKKQIKNGTHSGIGCIYSKQTEYLRNQLPHIANSDRIVNAILKYTDLIREEVIEHLYWGEGPIIEILDVSTICNDCDNNTIGLFKTSTPHTIYLDIYMVNTMEATEPGSLMGDALIYFG